LQLFNDLTTFKRDRIIYNFSCNDPQKLFSKVELPTYTGKKEQIVKIKQNSRNQSAADILNRVNTTKYQNKLKQLKVLAAAPTPGIKP